MNVLVTQLIFMSLQAVLIIGVIFGIRQLFAAVRFSKKYMMFLWAVPFFFLIFPWKILTRGGLWDQETAGFAVKLNRTEAADGQRRGQEDALKDAGGQDLLSGLIQSAEDIQMFQDSQKIPDAEKKADMPGGSDVNAPAGLWKNWNMRELFQNVRGELLAIREGKSQAAGVLSVVWTAGMLFFTLYGVMSYQRLKRKVLCSVRCRESVYYTDGIQTPVVLGYLKPRIYLPADMDIRYTDCVTAHEITHIERKDYLTKAAAYFIACLHWFNPAVWLAYYFMAKDMEMACDEETVAKIGLEKRKEYAAALLALSAGNTFMVPPAFGEGETKVRIKNIMHYKKTVKAAAVIALAAGICLTGIFLTANDQGIQISEARTGQPENERNLSGQSQNGPETAYGEKASGSTENMAGEKKVLTLDMVRTAFAQKTADQMDFRQYSNGEKKNLDKDTLDYHIEFFLHEEEETYRLVTTYAKDTDQLDDIYIYRDSDEQMRWIYTKDNEDSGTYPNSLEVFLNTKTKTEDWYTLKLPDGYTLGSYQGNLGDAGGALIFPQVYETKGDSYAPAEWRHAGFVGKAADPSVFVFQDGIPDENYFPVSNHSDEQPVGVMESITAGTGWHTLMVHSFHDLYTASDWYALEEQGIDVSTLENESEYWDFYFVKEGEQDAYVLSLSAKLFDESEAADIAGTVKITEDEAAIAQKKAVQNAVEAYLGDILNTMSADSTRDYDRTEFAGIDGYMAAKWFAAERELYKNRLGGIQSAGFLETELLQTDRKEEQVEALVNAAYQYTWGDGSSDHVCSAGGLFRVVLEQSGDDYQVIDLEYCDCAEIRILKEQIKQEGIKGEDCYRFVDAYFEQMREDA